jgi:hypothetical protein
MAYILRRSDQIALNLQPLCYLALPASNLAISAAGQRWLRTWCNRQSHFSKSGW